MADHGMRRYPRDDIKLMLLKLGQVRLHEML
jgi:hypothetical protein